jgi:hypothetical protein
LPRELSQHDLPEHLTEIRKGRCARLKAGALVDLPTVPWRWDSAVRIAVAPGITCFVKGKEYEHGGVSLQECVVPTITLVSSDAAADVSIERLVWTKLRCRVTLTGDHSGLRVDLHKRAADSASSAVDRKEPKAVDHEGVAALFVEDDRLEGTPVVLVVLDARGQVVKQIATLVGEE